MPLTSRFSPKRRQPPARLWREMPPPDRKTEADLAVPRTCVGVVFEPEIRNQFAFLDVRFFVPRFSLVQTAMTLPIIYPPICAIFFRFCPFAGRLEKMMPLRLVKMVW